MKQKQLIRECFREAVFTRDGYKCLYCEIRIDLDAHHITDRNLMPNGGYVKENGITLCKVHHLMAEKFHISNGNEWEKGFHPNELYQAIGSNLDQAISASKKLKT